MDPVQTLVVQVVAGWTRRSHCTTAWSGSLVDKVPPMTTTSGAVIWSRLVDATSLAPAGVVGDRSRLGGHEYRVMTGDEGQRLEGPDDVQGGEPRVEHECDLHRLRRLLAAVRGWDVFICVGHVVTPCLMRVGWRMPPATPAWPQPGLSGACPAEQVYPSVSGCRRTAQPDLWEAGAGRGRLGGPGVAGDEPGQVSGFVHEDAAYLAGRITARHQVGDLPSPGVQAGREAQGFGRPGV